MKGLLLEVSSYPLLVRGLVEVSVYLAGLDKGTTGHHYKIQWMDGWIIFVFLFLRPSHLCSASLFLHYL